MKKIHKLFIQSMKLTIFFEILNYVARISIRSFQFLKVFQPVIVLFIFSMILIVLCFINKIEKKYGKIQGFNAYR